MPLTFPDVKPAFPSTLLTEPRLQGFAPETRPSIERVIGLSRTPIVREFEFHVTVANSLTVQDFLFARVRDNKSFLYTHPDPYLWDNILERVDSIVGNVDAIEQAPARRYTCQKWSRSQTACNDVKIRVTFKEFYGF
jgi:hypothetical protein